MVDKQNKNKVTSSMAYRSRRILMKAAEDWIESLPTPSEEYSSLIFVYNEGLATRGRRMLFQQLNGLARENRQTLVITDIGFGRSGFYVNFDEIGDGVADDPGYDDLIEMWSESQP